MRSNAGRRPPTSPRPGRADLAAPTRSRSRGPTAAYPALLRSRYSQAEAGVGDAGIPHGCRIWDGRRRVSVSARRRRLGEAGSHFGTLTLHGPVEWADTEQLGDIEGAALAAMHQRDVESFLTAAQVSAGRRAACPLHWRPASLASAKPDPVGLELRDHGKEVDQQTADRIGGVVDRPAEAEAELASGDLIGDRSRAERTRWSLVTTGTSPTRKAARASRSPGASRLASIRPWSTWIWSGSTPERSSASRWAVRSC